MRLLPSELRDGAANAIALLVRGGPARLEPLPSLLVDQGPQRTLRRFEPVRGSPPARGPVLLVPPLAAPPSCFDLRRGCSLVEHLTGLGYPVYVVDYGVIGFGDRQLGLEHWVRDVIPTALRAVAGDAGMAVQPVGWCLGGIMLLLAAGAEPGLPLCSASIVASPFDFARVRLLAPIRGLARLTGGRFVTALYRALGGAPAPLVSAGFRLTGIDRYLTRPLFLVRHIADRDALAQMQAVDSYMANMLSYPGRSFGQLYHAFFRVNDLADGRIEIGGRIVDLRTVRVPVLAVAGESDVLAPAAAVHHVAGLLERAPEVRLATAPGGHLGVLTGRSAQRTTWRLLDGFLAEHEPPPRRRGARGGGGRRPRSRRQGGG